MQQVLSGGYNDALNFATTAAEYNSLMGGGTWRDEAARLNVMPTAGTISSLFVELSADPTNANSSYTFTIMKNSIAQTLTCTIAAGSTTGSDVDPAHAITLVAGDMVSLRCVATATDPVSAIARWSTLFTSVTAGESICMAIYVASTSANYYQPMQGTQLGTTSAEAQCPMPTSGTFKKLYVVLSADPGTDPDAYTIALQVAGGSVNNTVTIVANNKTGNITNVTDAVVAGDLVNFVVTPVSTPSVAPWVSIGIVFVSDTNGESLIFGGCNSNLANNGYQPICLSGGTTWDTTEANQYGLLHACTIKNLYVCLTVAPGADKSRTISINKDAGAASGLTVTISEAAKTGNDVTNTYTPANGDTADIKSVATNTPASSLGHTGVVCYIASGWSKKIYGVTPVKIYGVAKASIVKVNGV